MIAPSPDWVVGLTDQDMCDRKTGQWKTSMQGLLEPYTAGTDAGMTYEAPDEETCDVIDKQSVGVLANYGYWKMNVDI